MYKRTIRVVGIIFLLLIMVALLMGCGNQTAWRGPNGTYEKYERIEFNSGEVAHKIGLGKQGETALNAAPPEAPDPVRHNESTFAGIAKGSRDGQLARSARD